MYFFKNVTSASSNVREFPPSSRGSLDQNPTNSLQVQSYSPRLLCGLQVANCKLAVGKQDDQRRRELEMTQTILAYLKECPQAMDTIEGIAEWWIPRARIRADIAMLASVMEKLTKEGAVEEVGTGENRRYRLRPGFKVP